MSELITFILFLLALQDIVYNRVEQFTLIAFPVVFLFEYGVIKFVVASILLLLSHFTYLREGVPFADRIGVFFGFFVSPVGVLLSLFFILFTKKSLPFFFVFFVFYLALLPFPFVNGLYYGIFLS